jgi:hypothetical protein
VCVDTAPGRGGGVGESVLVSRYLGGQFYLDLPGGSVCTLNFVKILVTCMYGEYTV